DADASLRRVESEKAVLEGRAESLRVAAELGARRREGADALRRTHGDAYAARGILGELITVPSGLERAAEVALGDALDALVVAGASAADAVERAEADELDVLVAPTLTEGVATTPIDGARPLAEAIEAPSW